MKNTRIKGLHATTMANGVMLREAGYGICGCCGKSMRTAEIDVWIDDRLGDTASCPHCHVDCVIPDFKDEYGRTAIDTDTVKAFAKYWFGKTI